MMPRPAHWIVLAGIAGTLVASTAADARGQDRPAPVRARTLAEDLQMFSQVLNHLRVNHPDSIDTHTLVMAAIRGMLAAADPHSYAISAVKLSPEQEKAYRDGRLYPVPIDFTMLEGVPFVVTVAPGSAASREDILPGDALVEVDGRPINLGSTFELDIMLAGEKNAVVRLTFDRRRPDGTRVRLTRSVKRERIEEQSAIPTSFMLDPQTGYVRVTTFANQRVSDDLHDALAQLEKAGMQRLVLDLRDNGGGLVKEAASVAGEFLPSKTLVYTQGGRKTDVVDTGRVSRSFWRSEKRYPIVVMVNTGTASAAELVAAALQDHDRALIVGRPTFGKALVLRTFPLIEGSLVTLVVGHVRTPCGRLIQREYRGMSRQSYIGSASADRDTTGRPSCRTDGGRTVYGSGGIIPDVVFDAPPPTPAWLARAREESLILRWIGGHVAAAGAAYHSIGSIAANPRAAPGAVADFRAYARAQGIEIPPGSDADAEIESAIVRSVAFVKWGAEGFFRLNAVLDDDVQRAVGFFRMAEALFGVRR